MWWMLEKWVAVPRWFKQTLLWLLIVLLFGQWFGFEVYAVLGFAVLGIIIEGTMPMIRKLRRK